MTLLPGERWIVCPGPCGERKLASPDPERSEFWRHKSRERQMGDGLPRYAYLCKACAMAKREKWGRENRERLNARRRELYAQKRAEGSAIVERRREQNREANRRYRERTKADPARRAAEQARRHAAWERLKADPERYAENLQNQRIYARMRAERAGHSTRILSCARGGWRPALGKSPDAFPVEPLALWVDAALAQDGRDRQEIAESAGVDDRALCRVQNREYVRVTLGVADAILWGYGKAIRIPASVVEARLAEMATHWQSSPGNGERLIGYLTDAEQIAHLAGAVITRVEDLWLDLA
jgi:hypothetical protein